MNDYKNMWDFPLVDSVAFPDANRDHPLMQKRVDTLIRVMSKAVQRSRNRTVICRQR